jgi:hypothetical protein
MAHREWQDHWRGVRLPVHGHRTRVVVALIGFLLSIGAPIVVLSTPGLTAMVFGSPSDPRTPDNVHGRFG